MSDKSGARNGVSGSRDSGAALALVLLMVVILGLWLGAMTVLGQSTSSAVSQNVQRSNARAALVSSAVSQALADLNSFDAAGQLIGTKDNPCNTAVSFRGLYTDPGTGSRIRVDCFQSPDSGQTQPVGSVILSGDGCPATYLPYVTPCPNGIPELGLDGGLAMDSAAQLNVAGGGLVNASCAAYLGGSAVLDFGASAKSDYRIPAVCAGTYKLPTSYGTPFGPSSTVVPLGCQSFRCEPSEDYSRAMPNGQLASYIKGQARRTSQVADADLPTPTIGHLTLAQLSGLRCLDLAETSEARDAKFASVASGARVVEITPGLWTNAWITALNRLTAGSTTNCGYGGTAAPVVRMMPGLYRFTSDVPISLDIEGVTMVGGIPVIGDSSTATAPSVWTCLASDSSQGVEVQFSKYATLNMLKGRLILCPRGKDQPVLSALDASLTSSADQAFIDQRNPPLIYMKHGSGSCSSPCTPPTLSPTGDSPPSANWATSPAFAYIQTHGYVLAPGGSLYLDLSSDDQANFSNGAMFKALAMHTTGAAAATPSVSPPSAYNGDRFIQLRFWCVRGPYCPDGTPDRDRDLGIVQLLVRDRFGAEPGAAYEVLLWRTMW